MASHVRVFHVLPCRHVIVTEFQFNSVTAAARYMHNGQILALSLALVCVVQAASAAVDGTEDSGPKSIAIIVTGLASR